MNAADYFKKYAPDAQAVNQQYGIPTSIVLAASALESDKGASGLSSVFSNFFGIKQDQGYGSTYLSTTEYVNGQPKATMANFATYPDAAAGFLGYGKFLQSNDRYKPVFAAGNDYVKAADALQASGYATDPNYAQQLKDIIVQNNLAAYDLVGGAAPAGSTGITPTQVGGLQDFLNSVQAGTDTTPKMGDGVTVMSAADLAAKAAYDKQQIEDATHLNWYQGIIKAVFIMLLVGVLVVIVLQIFPLSPANIAKEVLKK